MILFKLLVMLMSAVALGEHEIYQDHIRLDGSLPTPQAAFQASSRVTDNFQENLLGHRSGIGASGLGAAANGVREQGVQTSVQAMTGGTGGLTIPPAAKDSWLGQCRDRFNIENF